MRLGICTIQRDRAPWIKEWVAFHYLMGFRKFYFFAHNCKDNTVDILADLQRRYDIRAYVVSADVERPQLKCYQFAYDNFGHEVDWMAFIDGDEFLFPVQGDDLFSILEEQAYKKISALGVWWSCFGSSGHIEEPAGLVTENYRHRAPLDWEFNRHVKSLVLGRQVGRVHMTKNSHFFDTPYGTFDEGGRLLTGGFMPEYPSTYQTIRINHYVCQSYSYYKGFKQHSGAADASAQAERPESWWERCNRNEEFDSSLCRFYERLNNIVSE